MRELIGGFQGSQNAGKVPVMEGGIEFKPLSLPPEDGQLLESRSFHVEQLCRWFDVPPIMIGHMEKSTAWGTGMEQMMLWFLTFSLRPHLERIEQAIKRDLVSPADDGIVAEFKVEGLLRADSAARATLYSSLVQNGIQTRNEVRRLENLPSVDGGDDLTVQTNLIPIQDLGKIATMPKDKPVEPGEAVQANPDPGGAAPAAGGGVKSRLPFSGVEAPASDFVFVWDRADEEMKVWNPDQLRAANGRWGLGGSTIGSAFLAAEKITGDHKILALSKRVTKYAGHDTVESYVANHKRGRAHALRQIAADHKSGKIALQAPEPAAAVAKDLTAQSDLPSVGTDARKFHDGMLKAAGNFGSEAECKISYEAGNPARLVVYPKGQSNPGSIVKRSFDFSSGSSGTVHHDYFRLEADAQGKNAAKAFLRDSVTAYRHAGVGRVELLANIDVGGYAWLKYGFKPNVVTSEGFGDGLHDAVDALHSSSAIDGTTKMHLDRLIRAEDFTTLSDFNRVVEHDGRSMSISKHLLLGSEWFGSLDLNDAQQMSRFESYVGKAR